MYLDTDYICLAYVHKFVCDKHWFAKLHTVYTL